MSAAECAAYDAPFPGPDFRAATRAFPEMVPEQPTDDGAAVSREAAVFWAQQWEGRSMMAVGAQDSVFTTAHLERLRQHIRGCPPAMLIAEGGHFVREHGAVILAKALRRLV